LTRSILTVAVLTKSLFFSNEPVDKHSSILNRAMTSLCVTRRRSSSQRGIVIRNHPSDLVIHTISTDNIDESPQMVVNKEISPVKHQTNTRKGPSTTPKHSFSHLSQPVLNEKQKQQLRTSWEHLGKRGPSGIGSMIFVRVFDRCPAVRDMFGFGNVPPNRLVYDPNFIKHAKVFVSVIEGKLSF